MAETVARELKSKILREEVNYQQPSAFKVHIDGDKAWIEDVKLLGFSSKNGGGRRYNPAGVNETLYESASINVDHPSPEDIEKEKPRAFEDRFGWVEEPYKNTDGLFAKRMQLNPKHRLFDSFVWWAKQRPDKVGLSQNAVGDVYEGLEGEEVDRITKVHSIDLVADPASTKGLFESMCEYVAERKRVETPTPVTPPAKKPVVEAKPAIPPAKKPTTPPVKKAVEKPLKEDTDEEPVMENQVVGYADQPAAPVMEDGMTDETPVDDGDDDSGISDALCNLAQKIFDDDSTDVKSKLKKLKALLTMKHEHEGMSEALKASVANLTEAKQLLLKPAGNLPAVKLVLEALDGYEVREAIAAKEAKADQLIEAAKLPKEAITPFFKRILLECKDERHMQEAIEDRRALTGTTRSNSPRSSAQEPLTEGLDGVGNQDKPLTEEEQKKNYDAFEAAVLQMAN